MNTARALLGGVGTLIPLAIASADATKYTYIGDIPATCPITIKRSAAQLPASFRITPEVAVKRASDATNIKCNSIFEQVVYADAENYYIIRSVLGPMSDRVEAVLVNGATGNVSVRK